MSRKFALFLAGGLPVLAGAAQAQTLSAAEVEQVIVTADPLGRSGEDVVSSVAVVSGETFVQRRQATLGDTLVSIPGVNSDTFGGGASRPVIRGQTAPRIAVLSDGVKLLDASEISPDHAVSGEPLLLEGVEVLRGPSALLYGGGAIGGAVNLIDKKVPRALPAGGFEGEAEVRLGSADNERAGVVGLTAGTGALVLRLEAASRHADDYEVPFYTPPTFGEGGHDHEHDHEDEDQEEHDHEAAQGFDELAGSYSISQTYALGASLVGTLGYIGLAYTEQASKYGLPGHDHAYESCHPHGSSLHCGGHDHGEDDHDHEHDHEHGDHVPFVDLTRQRVDVRGELNAPFAGVERIRFRGGYTDYAHDEVDAGVVGTTFSNEGYDARIEVQHAPIAGFRGVVGVQAFDSDFAAVGAESFVPPSNTKNKAIFVLEEKVVGDWRFEAALRQEWQETRAANRPDREHQPFSASLGANWTFAPGYIASITLARSQRAPHVQELYARGIHLASNTYELGGADLDEETVTSIELGLRKTEGPLTFSAGAYRYDYEGYIYGATLDRFENFRLIRYTQADATFSGVEGEVRYAFSNSVALAGFGDMVKADLDNGGALPRIPPARLGARGEFAAGPWSGDLEYVRVFEQDDIAAFETATPGYDLVNATLAYDLNLGGGGQQIFVRGSNLLDELALNHASFLTNVAPLRGRSFLLGLRTTF